jgi:hypothetical protein
MLSDVVTWGARRARATDLAADGTRKPYKATPEQKLHKKHTTELLANRWAMTDFVICNRHEEIHTYTARKYYTSTHHIRYAAGGNMFNSPIAVKETDPAATNRSAQCALAMRETAVTMKSVWGFLRRRP